MGHNHESKNSLDVDEEEVFSRQAWQRQTIPQQHDQHREEKTVIVPAVVESFELEEPEERCGPLCYKPDFLQRYRTMKSFLFVFIIAGLSQGMYYSYWNMSLSSIEKRLQIPSQTTGIITAINDVSHLLVVLLVAHFCGKGHRPRWMFVGSFIVGISVLLFATPEIFAPKWDADLTGNISGVSSVQSPDKETCLDNVQARESAPKCDADSQATRGDNTWALVLLGLAQVLLGIGTTAPIVLAMPFIDDNVKVKNAPIYFAFGLAGRFFGPLIGVLLGGFCLSTYIDLTKSPKIAQSDPRWMGAWYLGYIIIGSVICLTSCLYLCFPAKISHTASKDRAESAPAIKKSHKLPAKTDTPDSLRGKFKAIPRDLKRLLVNKIYVCRLVNDCIDMLVVSGYFNFASKYIEFHFRMSPAQAGRASGLSSILAMGTGAAVGGILIRRFKLQPKQVAFGILISSFLTAICYFFLMMVRCEPRNLHSLDGSDGMLLVDSACSNACNCAGKPFSPVCYEELQMNYYSPCHAGCTGVTTVNDVKYYTNCKCLNTTIISYKTNVDAQATEPTLWDNVVTSGQNFILGPSEIPPNPAGTVRRGFCEGGCNGFWTYVAISASFKFIGMLPFSGSQMLSFRIVAPDLKSLSKALQTFCASLFAFIPGPIIMGALIDSTCKLWNTQECGKKGACLIYDLDGLRLKMHLYVGIIKTIACLMDIYVYFKVRKMNFERAPEIVVTHDDDETNDSIHGSVKDLTKHD